MRTYFISIAYLCFMLLVGMSSKKIDTNQILEMTDDSKLHKFKVLLEEAIRRIQSKVSSLENQTERKISKLGEYLHKGTCDYPKVSEMKLHYYNSKLNDLKNAFEKLEDNLFELQSDKKKEYDLISKSLEENKAIQDLILSIYKHVSRKETIVRSQPIIVRFKNQKINDDVLNIAEEIQPHPDNIVDINSSINGSVNNTVNDTENKGNL